MPSTICTPSSGRLRFPASELFLSVFGFPVSGSFGSFRPHDRPAQRAAAIGNCDARRAGLGEPRPGRLGGEARLRSLSPRAARHNAKIRPNVMSCSVPGLPPDVLLHILLGGEKAGQEPLFRSRPAALVFGTGTGVLGGWLPDGQPERLPVDDGSAQTRANRALSARRRGVAESALQFDSSQHLSPRSRLRPNSHVRSPRSGRCGRGRNASWG
jgi:hypothetical protein